MNTKAEKYLDKLVDNAQTLVLQPDQFKKEEEHLRDFDAYEKIGITKYFKPEIQQQLRDQRAQMRIAKQLKKAKLS